MIEKSLIRALSNKTNLESYGSLLDPGILSSATITLLEDFTAYYKTFNHKEEIDWDYFIPYFFISRHPNLKEEEIEYWKHILFEVKHTELSDEIENLLLSFEKQRLYIELQQLINFNAELETIRDKFQEFDEKIENYSKNLEFMDIEDAIKYSDRVDGFKWRNDELSQHYTGGLIKGDFVIVAGYTNVGKTSFLASELSYMAEQIKDDRRIIWFNTEGSWKRILPRLYNASLNKTFSELKNELELCKNLYKEKMNGDMERIKIINAQRWHIKDIESLLKKEKPAIIIFDMLDAFRGFEKYSTKDSSFERYYRLYQWALEISNIYAPVIATSQTNREGNNVMAPDLTNFRASGIDKQSAANVVITIGKLNGEDDVRYLATPKFKVAGNESWIREVKFDAQRSRFI